MARVETVIAAAHRTLTRRMRPSGEIDPRWQAILDVADFIESDPDDVWAFIVRWGSVDEGDVRAAVATCLLEHLLEHHFDRFFPLVHREAVASPLFADTFSLCWKYGQTRLPTNSARFEQLQRQMAQRRAVT